MNIAHPDSHSLIFSHIPVSLILKQNCVHLEGWEGDARGRRYGNVCIYIADSLCYTAETNTPL